MGIELQAGNALRQCWVVREQRIVHHQGQRPGPSAHHFKEKVEQLRERGVRVKLAYSSNCDRPRDSTQEAQLATIHTTSVCPSTNGFQALLKGLNIWD
jgi:hypothetical protein